MDYELTLKDWAKQEKGRINWLAQNLKTHQTWISQIIHGHKKVPLETALKISALTNHEVTVEAIAAAYKNKHK